MVLRLAACVVLEVYELRRAILADHERFWRVRRTTTGPTSPALGARREKSDFYLGTGFSPRHAGHVSRARVVGKVQI